MSDRKTVFSGIQPTGAPHLGNYLGAIRHWVRLQNEHEAFFCIVDLHAITGAWDPQDLRQRRLTTAATLLACGIDPARSTLFLQSAVPAHGEMAWLLSCVARMGELRRMVQFKEKSKGETESVSVGLFTYPVLQAADVLLYQADGVPVGEDQRQHIELMRDIAVRFNGTLGETFRVPEAWIPPSGARIMALDDPLQKMSKSAARPNSSIGLTDPPDVIAKKVKVAVTDSGRDIVASADKPAVTNLLTILALIEGSSVPELEERFRGSGYGDLKKALTEALISALDPIRARYEELAADPAETAALVALGAEKASAAADATMTAARAAAGLDLLS